MRAVAPPAPAASSAPARTFTGSDTISAIGWQSTTISRTRCANVTHGTPSFLLDIARSDYPRIHLFDEPQFNTQDGYIGFMLNFFRKLRGEGRLVFLCLHPTAQYHVAILQEICERFLFVADGRVSAAPNIATLCADARAARYLGKLNPT